MQLKKKVKKSEYKKNYNGRANSKKPIMKKKGKSDKWTNKLKMLINERLNKKIVNYCNYVKINK